MPVATVITGADRTHAPLLHSFAEGLLHTDNFDLIQYPGAEAALMHTAERGLGSHGAQFMLRDVIQTKACESYNQGSRLCILIGAVACNQNSGAGYHECVRFVLNEREEVRKLCRFAEFILACFTPDRNIIPIPTDQAGTG